jgi:hypothetical protein
MTNFRTSFSNGDASRKKWPEIKKSALPAAASGKMLPPPPTQVGNTYPAQVGNCNFRQRDRTMPLTNLYYGKSQ